MRKRRVSLDLRSKIDNNTRKKKAWMFCRKGAPIMFDETTFERWCEQLAFSPETRKLIAHICSSPPSRVVQSSAGNVSGRYPSQKMHCSIQFESRRGELALIY